MPLSKAKNRERMQLKRDVQPKTINVQPNHPILYALIDPIKRKRLQDICKALDHRDLQPKLYYGCGEFSISFDIIEDLLEVTRGK